jgi:hypothetical protein
MGSSPNTPLLQHPKLFVRPHLRPFLNSLESEFFNTLFNYDIRSQESPETPIGRRLQEAQTFPWNFSYSLFLLAWFPELLLRVAVFNRVGTVRMGFIIPSLLFLPKESE